MFTVIVLDATGQEVVRITNVKRRTKVYSHIREMLLDAALSILGPKADGRLTVDMKPNL